MFIISETRDASSISHMTEEVHSLHVHLFPEIFKPYEQEAITAALSIYLKDPQCKTFIISNDEEAMGYVLCFIKEAEENAFHYKIITLYIDQICVLEKYRRSGVGKLLLERVDQLALELGIKRIELDHWSANNVAATYFRKNGYSLFKEKLVKLI